MVDSEFVVEDFNEFLDFVKERPGVYRFLEVGPDSIYAYMLGSERIAYRTNSKDANKMKEVADLLRKQGFIKGYRKSLG